LKLKAKKFFLYVEQILCTASSNGDMWRIVFGE